MKRFCAALLALILCFAPAVPALAESAGQAGVLTAEEFLAAMQKDPDTSREYVLDLFGQTVSNQKTTVLDYLKTPIGDDGVRLIAEVMAYLPNLRRITFDRCDINDWVMAQVRDQYPDKEVVWRVFFSPFSCMTDVETIWASCDLRSENAEALMYCTKVKNLDIGHSAMTYLDFLNYMPDLEVLILSCSDFEYLNPVASCPKLRYLEIAECWRITDLSPLSELRNLEHLHIGQCTGVKDLSPLYHLNECKNLKRFYCNNMWQGGIDIKAEEAYFRSILPDTVEIDFGWYGDMGSLNHHWRFSRGYMEGSYVPAYQEIRDIFGYDDYHNQARLWDP